MTAAHAFDPVLEYALDVLMGRKTAGPHVRAECQRHIDDRMNGAGRGIHFDVDAVLDAIEWFGENLEVEVGDEFIPFWPLDFQAFIIGSIFGWKNADGLRRVRQVYIEGGKGCGKSPLAAGIGLKMFLDDEEIRAEVYSAGAKREQAAILFNDAVVMVENSSQLKAKTRILGGTNPRKILGPNRSKFEPLSGDKKKSGQRPSCGLVDELHEHPDRYTIDMLEQGFKRRRQPLLFVITNSGQDRESICYEWHRRAIKVAHQMVINDEMFTYIMGLDEGDDPLEDESCWIKTNPGLGVTITWEYLRSQVKAAREVPGREPVTRRLNFCQWLDSENAWMTRDTWVRNEEDLVDFSEGYADLAPFEGADCFIGLDLSYTFDLTAMAFVFPEGDRFLAWVEYFTPLDTAKQREKTDGVPYTVWIRNGLIRGVAGSVIRKEHIGARLAFVLAMLNVKAVAYDNYAHKALEEEMSELGVEAPWIEHPQGFRRAGKLVDRFGQPLLGRDGKQIDNPLWMPESVKLLEEDLIETRLGIQPSPVTRWQVSSAAIREDPAGTGNRVFNKRKSTGRIDGLVALAQALGAANMKLPEAPNLSEWLSNPVIVR